MAKRTKKEGKIKNSEKENPVDFIAVKDDTGEEYQAKTIEAESKTKFEDDKGEGDVVTLRFFDFMANPETFRDTKEKQGTLPTPQQLFNAHARQIEIELWKDEWQVVPEVEPRLLFAKDKSHYRIVIAARPAKGSQLSYKEQPKTLAELVQTNANSPTNSH